MGMSEKEISKFLASKALNDAKLVRKLEVAPKKTTLQESVQPDADPHEAV